MGSVLRPKVQGHKGDGGPSAVFMMAGVVGVLAERSFPLRGLSSFTEIGPHHHLFASLVPLTKHPGFQVVWALGSQAC